ncbi:MAG: type 2 isopentenyl-diphosphate Delta-isomerase [Candidatus Baltobacteraceae bacterium]
MLRTGLGNGTTTNGHSRASRVGLTESRKAEHIRVNLEENVDGQGISNGFEEYRFVHCALPEIDFAEIDTSCELFGRRLAAPILISCMTGGTEEARQINCGLARIAQHLHLAMGLGSGRALLEDPALIESFDVRALAPDILLFANLGAVQLNKGYGVADCRRLVSMLGADALVLHVNALQEALQPEGDPAFKGLFAKIEAVCLQLEVPVIVKEVGWGIAPDTVRRLVDCGVSAVDVAGAGGTSWSEVERHRINEPWRARVAAAFAGWGISTAEALRGARNAAPQNPLIASGGIRSGIDIAKAIGLGAHLVGVAGPFLRAVTKGVSPATDLAREYIEVLRVAMFGIGARNLAELRDTSRLRRNGEDSGAPSASTLRYRTDGAGKFRDITDDVAAIVKASGVRTGLAHVYSMHTTAAIRINEHEDFLLGDFERFLERIAPRGDGFYDHDRIEDRVDVSPDEPRNGHSHCRHLLLASSETLPVIDGGLAIGEWQRIFLIELCSPRNRSVIVQVLGR